MNLVQNALQATKGQPGGAPRVRVLAGQEGGGTRARLVLPLPPDLVDAPRQAR